MKVQNVEDQQGKTTEELRDEAWDKLDEDEVSGTSPTTGLAENNAPDDNDDQPGSTTTSTDTQSVQNNTDGEQETSEAKALKDTKAWATKLSQENAELKRLIAEGATKKEVAAQEAQVETAKKDINEETLETVYREYPELKDVLNPLMETVKTIQQANESIVKDREKAAEEAEKRRKQEALDHFETKVMPKVMDGPYGHPDFKEIIANDDYFEWAQQQRPGLRTAALDSNDPDDIKFAISQYKRDRAKPEAAAMKQQEEIKRKEKLNNQQTLRGSSSSFTTPAKANVDPNDYDAMWDKLEKEETRNKG